jgi:hypothetical protein
MDKLTKIPMRKIVREEWRQEETQRETTEKVVSKTSICEKTQIVIRIDSERNLYVILECGHDVHKRYVDKRQQSMHCWQCVEESDALESYPPTQE